MCAEINPTKPAGASRKRQVLPVKTSARIAVVNPALRSGDGLDEAGRNNCAGRNAKSVKDVEPRETRSSVMAELLCGREGSTFGSHQPDEIKASPGSKTMACAKGLVRELGKTFKGRRGSFKLPWQGVSAKSGIIPLKVIRCLNSSMEAG